jgi:putative lipoprotein
MKLSTLLASVALASMTVACATTPGQYPSQNATSEHVISGQLTYRERIALPPGSTATVTISDTSRMDVPAIVLDEAVMNLGTSQVPVPFNLTVDDRDIDQRGVYTLRATIRSPAGELFWTTDTSYPVNLYGPYTDVGTVVLVSGAPGGAYPSPYPNNPYPNQPGAYTGLTGPEWIVEDINRRGVVDYSRATINFDPSGRISGNTSCNSYSASYTATAPQDLRLTEMVLTRKACAAALMNQERAFTDILGSARQYTITQDGALVIYAPNGDTITARR